MSTSRRLFPYVATFLVLLLAGAIFAFRPTPFIGLTGEALATSLDGRLGSASASMCEEEGEDAWRCDAATTAGERTYEVTINGFGCWTARPAGGDPEVGTPATLTGCITAFDH